MWKIVRCRWFLFLRSTEKAAVCEGCEIHDWKLSVSIQLMRPLISNMTGSDWRRARSNVNVAWNLSPVFSEELISQEKHGNRSYPSSSIPDCLSLVSLSREAGKRWRWEKNFDGVMKARRIFAWLLFELLFGKLYSFHRLRQTPIARSCSTRWEN